MGSVPSTIMEELYLRYLERREQLDGENTPSV